MDGQTGGHFELKSSFATKNNTFPYNFPFILPFSPYPFMKLKACYNWLIYDVTNIKYFQIAIIKFNRTICFHIFQFSNNEPHKKISVSSP